MLLKQENIGVFHDNFFTLRFTGQSLMVTVGEPDSRMVVREISKKRELPEEDFYRLGTSPVIQPTVLISTATPLSNIAVQLITTYYGNFWQ